MAEGHCGSRVRSCSYHAHIYYDPATKPVAERLREAIGKGFTVPNSGAGTTSRSEPHPISMYQVAFAVGEFPRLVPWLMLNHAGLNVLIHPQTGDAYDDHAIHALWLGSKLPLRLDGLRRAAR